MPSKTKTGPFANLKKGAFKSYLKNSEKIPAKHRKNTTAAARYIVAHKDDGFRPRTVRRARVVLLAAKYRNKRR